MRTILLQSAPLRSCPLGNKPRLDRWIIHLPIPHNAKKDGAAPRQGERERLQLALFVKGPIHPEDRFLGGCGARVWRGNSILLSRPLVTAVVESLELGYW